MRLSGRTSIYNKILIKRSLVGIAAVILVVSVWFSLKPSEQKVTAGITVTESGNTIAFGSGFYSISDNGDVSEKAGSIVEGVPNTIESYSEVSYLSAPVIIGSEQLNVTNKNIIVENEATILMEGSQEFASLTLNGGVISQPQPNREGNINSYQYSDQEWAIDFHTYLLVPAGQTRKLTCPTDYYQDVDNQYGNGCSTEYSPTYDSSAPIEELDDWVAMDYVWQTAAAAFDTDRYSEAGAAVINNDSGADRYYPIRIKFKNDNRDERNEIMRVVLRDGLDVVVGSDSGADLSLFYGVGGDGLVDLTKQKYASFGYYLLSRYVATQDNPEQGWILADLSNAFQSYSNNQIDIDTFFNSGYGQVSDGLFDLIFDDNTNPDAYEDALASSPFAKGTTTVYSEDVYRNYLRSTKTLNPSISPKGPSGRYSAAGLYINVSGDVDFNGGKIDLSGKGYSGYDFELRRGTDANALTLFGDKRGGGAPDKNSGGLSTNGLPQAAAHVGYGGQGLSAGGGIIPSNTNIYGSAGLANTVGSGGGAAFPSTDLPSVGGDGGGKLALTANNVNFNSPASSIISSAKTGHKIYSSSASRYSGGSGGSISVVANALHINYLSSGPLKTLDVSGAAGAGADVASGGSGGYIRLALNDLAVDGDASELAKDKAISYLDLSGGISLLGSDYSGDNGESLIETDVDPVSLGLEGELAKRVEVLDREASTTSLTATQIATDEQVQITIDGIKGKLNSGATERRPIDIVLISDLSESMNELGSDGVKKVDSLRAALNDFLDTVAELNRKHDNYIQIGMVDFPVTWVTRSQKFSLPSGVSLVSDPEVITHEMRDYVATNYVEGRPYGTPAGSGLLTATNILTGDTNARNDAYKYAVLLSDGEENYQPCMTTTSLSHCGIHEAVNIVVPPEAGTPAAIIKSNNIAMFDIFIPNGDAESEAYNSKLEALTTYLRPAFIGGKTVHFDSSDYTSLRTVYMNILSTILDTDTGMPFEIHETLPPGTVVDEVVLSNASGIIDTCRITPSVDEITQTKIDCSIDYFNYSSEPAADVFKLVMKVKFAQTPSGNYDLDQNRVCHSDGTATPELLVVGDYSSYVLYKPNLPVIGSVRMGTESVCREIVSSYLYGDVFDVDSYLSNFAFYGRNLNQSSSMVAGADTSWDVGFYSINTDSQSSYNPAYYQSRIDMLKSEARTASLPFPSELYLNGVASFSDPSTSTGSPEGSLWRVTGLAGSSIVTLPSADYSYSGLGTIIIDGDLEIPSNSKILKHSPLSSGDSLGLIVTGDLVVGENVELNAAILCLGAVRFVGDQAEITGSILAESYEGLDTRNGLRIRYDYRLGKNWPPGFRYFNMPIAYVAKP